MNRFFKMYISPFSSCESNTVIAGSVLKEYSEAQGRMSNIKRNHLLMTDGDVESVLSDFCCSCCCNYRTQEICDNFWLSGHSRKIEKATPVLCCRTEN